MTLKDILQTIQKWLFLKDTQVVEVLLATIIANRLPTDPVWLFIIAPPSSAKTELIRALNKIPQIYSISNLTPQTFISGKIGKTICSLLPQLNDKILTLKDFTTVLTMHRENRTELLAQLREIYDGYYKKAFGTGLTIEWQGKMGFIAGVTPIIDTYYSIYQVLGERFIQYRMAESDAVIMAKRAMQNVSQERQMREEIMTAIAQFISAIDIPEFTELKIPEEITNKLAHLAAFCVRARSGVIRGRDQSGEISYIPEPEAPARLAKQLLTLACGLAILHNSRELTLEEYALTYRIGMDTLPKMRLEILRLMKNQPEPLTTTELVEKTDYPDKTIRRHLEDLLALKVIKRLPARPDIPSGRSGGPGKKPEPGLPAPSSTGGSAGGGPGRPAGRWQLSDHDRNLLDKAEPQ